MDPGSKTEEQQIWTKPFNYKKHMREPQFPVLKDFGTGEIAWNGVQQWSHYVNNFQGATPGFPPNQLPQNYKTAKPEGTATTTVKQAAKPMTAQNPPNYPRKTPIIQTNLLKAGMKFDSNPASKYDKTDTTTIKD